MMVKMSRELKSPREETATIEISWDPSSQDEDHIAALVAAVVDMADKYTDLVSKSKQAPEITQS